VLGRCALDLFPDLREHGVDRLLARALAGELVRAPEMPYRVAATGRAGWVRAVYRPHVDATGTIIGAIAVVHDITSRKQAEQRTERQTAVVSGIARIFREAMTCETEEELGRACLKVAEEATQSHFGFLGEIDPHTGTLVAIARSDPGGDPCPMPSRPAGSSEAPVGLPIPGLYERVLTDGKAFFTNEPVPHPERIDTPPGHPALTACLGVPLLRAGQVFGMVGLGNRDDGYGPDELEAAEALAPAIVQAFLHKRAQAALRESQMDLNRAQAVAQTGSWRIDVAGNRLVWSEETHRIFGVPTGTPLSYQTFLAAVHPDDRAAVDAAWQAALQGAPYDVEHRIVVGADVKWVRERAELELDEHGVLRGGFGTVQDITDRKEAEAERRRITLFPDQNPSPVIRIARDGRILYANAASQPLLEAWGCAVGSRLGPAAFLQVSATDQPIEHELVCQDRIYSVVCVPFEAEGYVNLYGRDITERKRAEAALAASQHLLHSVLEQAAEGITVRDAQGGVLFVNAVARRRALRRPEGTALECAPEVWGDYLDADGKPVPIEEWPTARALRGETASREFLRRTPTGSLFVLNSAAPLRNEQGAIIGAVAITTDISERKRMEDRLRDALAHEQRALADNVTLLREVHHRTKNNLQMLCDLLYLKAETLPAGEPRALLEDSYGRIYAFARLHEQLYETMQGGEVRLGEYLARLVASVQQFAAGATIRVEAVPGDHALDLDRAISAGLIVNELVTNALKHAFPKGQPGAIGVRLQVQGGDYVLDVWDTGPGLPPGFDAEKAPSLGLRLVRLLAHRLQATVTLKTEPGAAFTIRFPVQRK
jgi:PAS domain S-box-containing protein